MNGLSGGFKCEFRIGVDAGEQCIAILVEQVTVVSGVGLDKSTVTAEEIRELGAPAAGNR